MSQTVRKGMIGFVNTISELKMGAMNKSNSSNLVYQPTNIYNFIEFLQGNNAQNNPQKSNTAPTVGCTFPSYYLIRINTMSSIITFLKICAHLLPTINSQSDERGYASVFDVPGLQAARETTIKLAYLTGVSCRAADDMRWNKEQLIFTKEKDYRRAIELRAIRSVLGNVLGHEYISQIDKRIIELAHVEGCGQAVIESQLGFVGIEGSPV